MPRLPRIYVKGVLYYITCRGVHRERIFRQEGDYKMFLDLLQKYQQQYGIKMFSYVEDWVLDPFLGSGTTMKAAKDLGRNSVGIELNPDYLPRIEEKVGMVVEAPQGCFNSK